MKNWIINIIIIILLSILIYNMYRMTVDMDRSIEAKCNERCNQAVEDVLKKVERFKVTAYSQRDGWKDGKYTYSGLKLDKTHEYKVVACDKNFYRIGTKFMLEGVGVVECQDIGVAVKGLYHLDLYVSEDRWKAVKFGTQFLNGFVVE